MFQSRAITFVCPYRAPAASGRESDMPGWYALNATARLGTAVTGTLRWRVKEGGSAKGGRDTGAE